MGSTCDKDIPISIAPAVEPAMIDRNALGRCFLSAAAGSLATVAIVLVSKGSGFGGGGDFDVWN